MSKTKIIVDAYGGDNAPLEILRGCAMAVKAHDVSILLTGSEQDVRKVAAENKISLNGMEILDAPDVISMSDHPTSLMKEKKDSSLAVALRALSEGKGDAFVGAGSTGAILTGATLIVGRIKGIKRPAIAPVCPKDKGVFMLIDCGANADCRPEMLVQFAKMGSVYMENVMGVKNPRVGLANIGAEDTKGDALRLETFPLLKEAGLNFVGNVEARDITADGADVIVTDGFTGNIILKLMEGVSKTLLGKIKGVIYSSAKNKLAGKMLEKGLKKMRKELDPDEYGGAPFLGVKAPVFKAHGSCKAQTFCNAIGQAAAFARADVISKISEG